MENFHFEFSPGKFSRFIKQKAKEFFDIYGHIRREQNFHHKKTFSYSLERKFLVFVDSCILYLKAYACEHIHPSERINLFFFAYLSYFFRERRWIKMPKWNDKKYSGMKWNKKKFFDQAEGGKAWELWKLLEAFDK